MVNVGRSFQNKSRQSRRYLVPFSGLLASICNVKVQSAYEGLGFREVNRDDPATAARWYLGVQGFE